jgi:NhaP-type Na+/H+ or K+/H+ antiporter
MLFSLIASVVTAEVAEAAGRARSSVVAYVAGAILAVAGIGFLVGAGYVATARRIGDLEACLAFGAGFLVLAILVVVIQRLVSRMRARQAAERRRRELAEIAAAATAGMVGSKGGVFTGLAASLLTGFVLGLYRENRRDRD